MIGVQGVARWRLRAGQWAAPAGLWRRPLGAVPATCPAQQEGVLLRLIDPAIPLGNFVSILQVTHCGAVDLASRLDGFQQRFQLGPEFGRRFLRGHLKVADLLDVVF